MRFFLVLIGIAIVQSACSTLDLNRRMASWQDMRYEDVVQAWGEPASCDESGHQLVCRWPLVDPERADGPEVPAPACVRLLAVDTNGRITGWRWRGNRCVRLGEQVAAQADGEPSNTVLAASTRH
jgi:hypothetical protein